MATISTRVLDVIKKETGIAEESLAEFIIDLAKSHRNKETFGTALEEIDPDFPATLKSELWKIFAVKEELSTAPTIVAKRKGKESVLESTPPDKRAKSGLGGLVNYGDDDDDSSDEQDNKVDKSNSTGNAAILLESSITSDTVQKRSSKEPAKNGKTGESGLSVPEGFFDDGKLDAKMRKVEYKNDAEEAWKEFEKEMEPLVQKSDELVDEAFTRITTQRIIEEEEQQRRLNEKVNELKKIGKEILSRAGHNTRGGGGEAIQGNVDRELKNTRRTVDSNDDEEDDSDDDDNWGWRSKGI